MRCARAGLPADALEIEITENIALDHDERCLSVLQQLRDKGINLAFDDFGTGYASLSYLTRYPLSRIKIDRSFVRKITDDAGRRRHRALAHRHGAQSRARGDRRGRRDGAQAAFLRNEKCEEAQGYLYAKPLPAHEFEEFLRANRNRPAAPQRRQSRWSDSAFARRRRRHVLRVAA